MVQVLSISVVHLIVLHIVTKMTVSFCISALRGYVYMTRIVQSTFMLHRKLLLLYDADVCVYVHVTQVCLPA
jgi:hypothetical protein